MYPSLKFKLSEALHTQPELTRPDSALIIGAPPNIQKFSNSAQNFHQNTLQSTISQKQQHHVHTKGQPPETPPIVVKDYNFYKGKMNLWDKEEQVSPKVYKFYFQYQKDDDKIKLRARQQEMQDQLKREDSKKSDIQQFRLADRERMKNRKLERKVLQYESQQNLDVSSGSEKELENVVYDEDERRRIVDKKTFKVKLSNRADNPWNNFTQQNQKYVNQTITPLVLRKDEEAMASIEHNFLLQQLFIQKRNEQIQQEKNVAKKHFKMRHLQNYMFEKTLGMQKINRNLGITHDSQKRSSQVIDNEDLEQIKTNSDYFPCKFVKSRNILSQKQLTMDNQNEKQQDFIRKISKPKGANYFAPGFLLQHGDYKGLFIGEVDDHKASQKQNPLIKKLLPSHVLQANIIKIKNSRPGTSKTRPQTALSTLNFKTNVVFAKREEIKRQVLLTKTLQDFNQEHIHQKRQDVLNELDTFDEKFASHRKIGYPQTSLLEAYNLCSAAGFQIEKQSKILNNKRKML